MAKNKSKIEDVQEGLTDEDRAELEATEKTVSSRSSAQIGVPKKSVRVKANGVVYSNLTKALAANGFDKVKDWPKVRNQLKKDGIAALGEEDSRVVFESTDEDVTAVEVADTAEAE